MTNTKRNNVAHFEISKPVSPPHKKAKQVTHARTYHLRSSKKVIQGVNVNGTYQSDVETQKHSSYQLEEGSSQQRTKLTSISSSEQPNKLGFSDARSDCSLSELDSYDVVVLRETLLNWYMKSYREFPWRTPPRYKGKDKEVIPLEIPNEQSAAGAPYAVWISEVMSQQTRISVVVEYYQRWMKEFPSVQALANTPLDRVNELWAGLGYYRRARFLHEGAKQVLELHDGSLPPDVPSLLKLKGIGKYTAGAISSIAFGRSEPAVDGNVERVFSRLLPSISESTDNPKIVSDRYWNLARRCVEDIECAGDFNQAMMDFGATICKPKAPNCLECPMKDLCGAYKDAVKLGEKVEEYVTRYPVKKTKNKTKVREEEVFVLVVSAKGTRNRKYLVTQRSATGLLAGLWEAPNAIVTNKTSNAFSKAEAAVEDVVKEACTTKNNDDSFAFNADRGNYKAVTKLTHIFSHIRQKLVVTQTVVQCSDEALENLSEGETQSGIPFRWLSLEDIEKIAISTQMRKVFAAIKKK